MDVLAERLADNQEETKKAMTRMTETVTDKVELLVLAQTQTTNSLSSLDETQAEALEPDADYQLQPIALVSGAFSPAARKNWHAHTAELYGIYAALKKLRNLIDNVALVVETDHCNLLQAQTNHSALARRWIHWIRAEFNILHIVHRRGIRNALADACSRAFDIAAHDAKLLMGVKGPEIGRAHV
jgi:hypothetical protein